MQAHKIITLPASSLAADDSVKRGTYRRVTGCRQARVIAVPITQI
jgi:hypothetical protein